MAVAVSAPSAWAQPAPPVEGRGVRPVRDALAIGPSHCLDREILAHHVVMWLGRDELDARLYIRVDDTATGVTFAVVRDGLLVGSRTLQVVGVACQEIHAAAGLGIATALDATILAELGVTPPVPPIAPPSAPPPAPSAPPASAPPLGPPPTQPSPRPPREDDDSGALAPWLTSTVQVVALLGVLPEVELGLSPSFDFTLLRWLDVRAGALGTPAVEVELEEGLADVSLVGGRLDVCAVAVLQKKVARLRGCAGVTAGAVSAEGSGFARTQASTAPWVAPTVRIDGRWSFGRVFGLLLSVDGFFPGVKPELQVLDAQGAVRSARSFPLAGVAIGLGPSITF